MAATKTLVPVNKVCEHCGQIFKATTSYQIRIQKFCNRKCRTAVHGNGRTVVLIHKNCLQCGKEMEFWPAVVKTKKFCSRSCSSQYHNKGPGNPAWKGGTSVGGKYWKRKARERDNFTCQFPGCTKYHKGKGTHAHHKIPLSVGGDSSLENLITLCSKHHKEIERRLLARLVEAFPEKTKEILTELYASSLRRD